MQKLEAVEKLQNLLDRYQIICADIKQLEELLNTVVNEEVYVMCDLVLHTPEKQVYEESDPLTNIMRELYNSKVGNKPEFPSGGLVNHIGQPFNTFKDNPAPEGFKKDVNSFKFSSSGAIQIIGIIMNEKIEQKKWIEVKLNNVL